MNPTATLTKTTSSTPEFDLLNWTDALRTRTFRSLEFPIILSFMRTAAVLTVSDSSAHGLRADLSGPSVAEALRGAKFTVVHTEVVADETELIQSALIRLCDQARLVVTTGGTGIAERDVTPEATRAVCSRLIEGLPERMRAVGSRVTPMAALSRSVCGIRERSLIVNLPGSPTAARESLAAVIDLLPHILDLIAGKTAHKGTP